MSKRYHLSIDAWNCSSPRLKDNYALDWFLRQVAGITNTKILNGPTVVNRGSGITGMTASLITDSSHIIIHTFPNSNEATIDLYSYEDLNHNEIREFITKYFDLDINSIKLVNVANEPDQFIQCEEPGCIRKATKVWGGRKVCSDHYDYYRDQELRPELYDDDIGA